MINLKTRSKKYNRYGKTGFYKNSKTNIEKMKKKKKAVFTNRQFLEYKELTITLAILNHYRKTLSKKKSYYEEK